MLASTLMIVPEKPGSAHTFTHFDFPNFPLGGSKSSGTAALKAFPAKLAKLAMKLLLQWSTIPEEAIRHINGGFDIANQVCDIANQVYIQSLNLSVPIKCHSSPSASLSMCRLYIKTV